MVGDEAGLAQGRVRLARREDIARAQRLDERRLGNAVEVQVVLADELVDLRVLRAPEVAPAATRQAHLVVDGHGEAHGSPQAFGPAPHRQALEPVDDRRLHAPLDVAGDAEGNERLARAETDARRGKHVARRIAVVDGVELDLEGLLALLGLMVLVMRQLVGDFQVLIVQLVFDVDHRRSQELLDGLRHDGTNLGVGLKGLHVLFQEVVERRQVEVPVLHRAHLGRDAGERGLRRDKILRRIAVA